MLVVVTTAAQLVPDRFVLSCTRKGPAPPPAQLSVMLDPLAVMLVRLEVTVVVVEVVGTLTLTVTNPEEALKPLLPP